MLEDTYAMWARAQNRTSTVDYGGYLDVKEMNYLKEGSYRLRIVKAGLIIGAFAVHFEVLRSKVTNNEAPPPNVEGSVVTVCFKSAVSEYYFRKALLNDGSTTLEGRLIDVRIYKKELRSECFALLPEWTYVSEEKALSAVKEDFVEMGDARHDAAKSFAWKLIQAETGSFAEARKAALFAVCAFNVEYKLPVLNEAHINDLMSGFLRYEGVRGCMKTPHPDALKALRPVPSWAYDSVEMFDVAIKAYEQVRSR